MLFQKLQLASNRKGSTLINLIFTLSIFIILGAIAAPTLQRYQPNLHLKTESTKLISDLRYAQQRTVSEQQIYYVEIHIDTNQYFVIKQSDPSSPIKTESLNNDITFQSITGFTADRVVFNSYGAVSESGTIVLVNTQEQTATIQVKPSGYVQLEQ